jgi:hypothetical protein
MSCQVKTSGQCQLYETEKHQYFSIVSLPTDSVIVDHAVLSNTTKVKVGAGAFVLWRPKNFGRHFLDIQVKCK